MKIDFNESDLLKEVLNFKIVSRNYLEEKYGFKRLDYTIENVNDFLRENIVVLSEKQLKNKNIQFFLERNPDYKKGDELVCLAEISIENLTNLGKRVLKEISLA